MGRRRISATHCFECGKEFAKNERKRAIYPVPNGEPGQTDDNTLTGFVCASCFPSVVRQQVELGLAESPIPAEE